MPDKKSFFRKHFYDPNPEEAVSSEDQSLKIPRLNLSGNGIINPTDLRVIADSRTPVGEVDDDCFQNIRGELLKVPVSEGFSQFVIMFNSMADTLPDESQRFRIAFATCAKMYSLSIEQVRVALRDQEKALDDEAKEFETSIAEDVTKLRQDGEQKISVAKSQIIQIDLEKERLKQQFEDAIAKLNSNREAQVAAEQVATTQLSQIDQDIEVTRQSFIASHAAVVKGYPQAGWIGIEKLKTMLSSLESNFIKTT